MNGGFFKWFIFITHQTHFHSNVLTKNVLLVLSIYISLYSYKIILFVDNYCFHSKWSHNDRIRKLELENYFINSINAPKTLMLFFFYAFIIWLSKKKYMYFLRNYDLQEIWCNFKHLIRTYNPLKRHSKLTSCLRHWYDVIPTVVENRYNRDSSVREDVGWCSLIVFINLLEDKCINQYWLKRKSSFPRCFAPIFTIFCASMITKRKEILIILWVFFHLAA